MGRDQPTPTGTKSGGDSTLDTGTNSLSTCTCRRAPSGRRLFAIELLLRRRPFPLTLDDRLLT